MGTSGNQVCSINKRRRSEVMTPENNFVMCILFNNVHVFFYLILQPTYNKCLCGLLKTFAPQKKAFESLHFKTI